jgi:hypothetical protein
MILRVPTTILLPLASLWLNETKITDVKLTREATSALAVNIASVNQDHGSALADTVVPAQNEAEKARRAYEQLLANYQRLAEKDPETYLPGVAARSTTLQLSTVIRIG